MAAGLHYTMHCPDCGKPILLHEQRLARAMLDLKANDKGSELLAAVCAHCKHVRNYDAGTLNSNLPYGPVLWLRQISDWSYIGCLSCDVDTCETRLPLFAPLTGRMSLEDWAAYTSLDDWAAYIDTWNWDGLKCSAGHRIPEPKTETPGN